MNEPLPPLKKAKMSICMLAMLTLVLAVSAQAQAPDLTAGGVRSDSLDWNLGPTGCLGWMYRKGGKTTLARQILVTVIEPGSPAHGTLALNDVILGVDGAGASPGPFASDPRMILAKAIEDAEARNVAGNLKLLVWRAGTTSEMSITLPFMDAYAATAPYNCPKSEKILKQGVDYIMKNLTTAPDADGGTFSFRSLVLLAVKGLNYDGGTGGGNDAARQAQAATEVRSLILSAADIAEYRSGNVTGRSKIAWKSGHELIVLSEYYLQTGDPLVLPSIEAYAVLLSNGASMFGTMGHQLTQPAPEPWSDGSTNGAYLIGYGTVYSAAVPCYLGLSLANKCNLTGLTGAETSKMNTTLERMSRQWGHFEGWGTPGYGEAQPQQELSCNGRTGAAAIGLSLDPNRDSASKYFAKCATGGYLNRESGHTGPFFNMLWSPLGAAVGGEECAAAHFAKIKWHLDLARRWDGGFYYGPDALEWNDFSMSTAALLTYALPLRQLEITGKSFTSNLDTAEVDAAIFSGNYDNVVASRSDVEILDDLFSWSRDVREIAANHIASNRVHMHASVLPSLRATALNTSAPLDARTGAMMAIGLIKDGDSAATLASLLTDPSARVRYFAAWSMKWLPQDARMSQLNYIMSVAINTAAPVVPMYDEDPFQWAHGHLSSLLFRPSDSILQINGLDGVNRPLLYGAIRALAVHPDGTVRNNVANMYDKLNAEDMNALAETFVVGVLTQAQARKPQSGLDKPLALYALEKHNKAEGVPLAMRFYNTFGWSEALDTLGLYGESYLDVTPQQDVIFFLSGLTGSTNEVSALAALDAIASDPSPADLTEFKSISSVTADQPILELPANSTNLHCVASDFANGDLVYTWRKVHGAGTVTFAPNGTAAAADTSVVFSDNVSGQYLFEVTVSDSRNLTEVSGTVAVTLEKPGGGLNPNASPTATDLSVATPPYTPVKITLSGSDPEGLPLIFTVTEAPLHGTLSGSAPNLSYLPDKTYFPGTDSLTFHAIDSEGNMDTGTVSIEVLDGSALVPLTHVYEPFDYPIGGQLAGMNGGIGMSGVWQDGHNWGGGTASVYDATSMPIVFNYGNLNWNGVVDNLPPQTGGFIGLTDDNIVPGDSWEVWRPLAQDAGTMAGADGVLWASFVLHQGQSQHVAFALATDCFIDGANKLETTGSDGAGLGNGIGISGEAGIERWALNPVVFNGGLPVASADNTKIIGSKDFLVVLKFEFGETDTVRAYLFPETLAINEISFNSLAWSATAQVDESTLNAITFSKGRIGAYDEVRIGDTFSSVINAGGFAPSDVTRPSPNPSTFAVAPMAVSETSLTMTATTATDENVVEYYFTCTSGNAPDSGWQDETLYYLTGLTPETEYTFTVKARDKSVNRNATTASAPASATTFAVVPSNMLVYEGFNYPNGSLVGKTGGTGFSSPWIANRGAPYVWNELTNLTIGTLTLQWDGVINNPNIRPTPHIGAQYAAGSISNKNYFYRTLAASAGNLAGADGVLWMTTLVHSDRAIGIGLSNSYLVWTVMALKDPTGDFIGVGTSSGTTLQPHVILNNGASKHVGTGGTLPAAGEDWILVMKYTFSGTMDTIEAHAFSENDVLSESAFNAKKVTATLNGLDESTLNILTIALEPHTKAIDEIRIGNTFFEALGPDASLPALASTDMVDDRSGSNLPPNELVTYTVTFSEDISPATLTADDFGNAGTASITIGAITAMGSGVFTVEATPTSEGTLQFQINAGAVIEDFAGNSVDTASAILDDTIIVVNVPPTWNQNPIALVDVEVGVEYAGKAVALATYVTDPSSDPLTFVKVSGPAWLTVAPDGTLSGTPGIGDLGTNSFTVSVTDGNYAPVNAVINIGVAPIGNQAPTVGAGLPVTVTIDYSPWTPAAISSVAWYDASDATTIVQSGGLVSQWGDKSGNGKHMLQGTSANQPTSGTRQINGLNAIDFDGSTDLMQQAANAFGSSISNVSLFTVIQSDNFDMASSSIIDLDGNGQMAFYEIGNYCFEVNNQRNFDGWTQWGNSNVDMGKTGLHSVLYGGSQDLFQGWQHGTLLRASGAYDANPIQATNGGMRLGTGAGTAYNGLFAEIVIVNGVVDAATRQKIEGYLAHKWGTATNLPIAHPYRWAAPIVGAVANLDGTVNDPDADALTTTWSAVSGPGEVVFRDATAVDTTATFLEEGSYDLRLDVTDSYYNRSEMVTITVEAPISVTYDQNGAVVGTLPSGATAYNLNDTVTVLGNTGGLDNGLVGLVFNGWNTAPDGSGTAYNAGATFQITASTTLYAQWLAVPTYAITYNGNENNGGTVPTSQVKTQTKDLILATNSGSLFKNNLHFAGWNTAPDGSGINYAPGATFSTDADTTLYAVWAPRVYAIDFGSTRVEPGFVGMTATTRGQVLFQDNLTVNYWSQNATATGVGGGAYFAGDSTGLSTYLTFDSVQVNTAGNATGVTFGNGTNLLLPAGDWHVEIWAYDQANGLNQDFGIITGVTNGASGAELQWTGTRVPMVTGAAQDPVNPAATFTFTSDGFSTYGIYAAGTAAGANRSRISGVRLTHLSIIDTIPPMIAASNFVDNKGGASVEPNDTVTYTVTFNEDMDASTVTSDDFINAGSAAIVIGTITETSPGVFLVAVTPTSGGSLQLSISAGAQLADLVGLLVNTTTAILDNTTITVNAIPVALDQNLVVDEDTALPITLTGTDGNSDPLTYAIVSQPVNGTLSGTAPNLTYTPSSNFNGSDSFTFYVNDGLLNSNNTATVSITINSVNDVPIADAKSAVTSEDNLLFIVLTGSDVENSPLTYTVVTPPANGSLSGSAPNLTYTPDLDYNGADSFTYKVDDGLADSDPVTVSITVLAVNDAPEALSQIVATDEDTDLPITLEGTDADNNPLTYTVVTDPQNGSLSGTSPNLIYTPNENFNGDDSFEFRVRDGSLNSLIATVSITVAAVNDVPLAIAQNLSTPGNTALPVTLAGTDVENSPLTYTVVTPPANGTLSGTVPNVIYTPDSNFNGADSFTFTANDGTADSAPATIEIIVNTAPVALAQNLATDEETDLSIALAGTDVESNPLTYTVVSSPANGVLSGTAPNLTYTPNNNFNGADSFTFKVNDGLLDSSIATISLTVNPINDAPIANDASATIDEDTFASITLTASDVDTGDTLTYTVVTNPTNGTLSGIAPNLTYTPNSNYYGSDSFSFKVNDGTVDSNIATVSITVNSIIDFYTVTFDATGGTTPNPTSITVSDATETSYGALATTSRAAYTFIGWFTAASGGTLVTSVTTVTATADHTLYAQWGAGTEGTWLPTAAGPFDWGTPANWVGGIVASGADRTAYFTPNITANQIANLDAPRTIGNITFTDSTTSSHNLTISGANILTLSRSSGAPIIDVTQSTRTLTISSEIAGNNGLQKSGAGILTLSGANTYSGATTVNSGTLRLSSANTSTSGFVINGGILGDSSNSAFAMTTATLANKNITVNGVGTLGVNAATTSGAITLNDDLSLWTQGAANFNGAVTGAGKLSVGYVSQSNTALNLNSSGNTFTGGIDYPKSGNGQVTLSVKSFVDTATLGAGNIRFGITSNGGIHTFDLGSGYNTGGLTLNNRQFVIAGNTTAKLSNSSAEQFTINSDLLVSATGIRTLQLGGNGAGTTTFAGDIGNGTLDALNLNKVDGGRWILSGSNTYTGSTTIGAGTLSISSIGNVNGSASSLGTPSSAANGLILIGSASATGTLLYTGSGHSSDRAIQINSFANTNPGGAVITNNGTGALTFTATTFNNAYTNASTVNRVLTLSGSNGGQIQGVIQNNSATNSVGLTKTGTGTWTLSGASSYTGATTISAGKLFINGDQSAASGNVSVAASATLGGFGTLGGNTTIAANGRLEFNLSTASGSHDPLDLAAGKTLTFSGASVLTITSTGGSPALGTYTLVNAPGGITGSAPATVNLPAGWVGTTQIIGNSLVLNVTTIPSGPGPVDHFAISAIASPQTVGTAITGITITAQDASNQTATSFTGTITFGGTAGITGTSASFVAGVLSGVNVTPTVAGSNLTFTVDDGAGHTGSATFSVRSLYEDWAGGTFANPFTDTGLTDNPDGDNLNNLMEFAFGTDPTVQDSGSLAIDGSANGSPLPVAAGGGVFEFYFVRRKDHDTSGSVSYTVQFSNDLSSFTDSLVTPTFVTNSSENANYEVVKVPFSVGSRFGRIEVNSVP